MSCISWDTIGKDGSPVRGDPWAFHNLAGDYTQVSNEIQQTNDDLRAIRFGSSTEFRGDAADAFSVHIANLAEPLGKLPTIALDLASIFEAHEQQLKLLQKRASSALANAATCWEQKQDAASQKQLHGDRLESIRSQLECLCASDEYRRESLLETQYSNTEQFNNAHDRERQADSEIRDIGDDWEAIREQEIETNEGTAYEIRNSDLGPLSDPGFWEKLGQFFDNILEWQGTLVRYLFSMDFLEDVYNSLGIILIALSLIALVFASGGLALPAVIFGLAAAKALIGTALYFDNRISGGELLLDYAAVALAGVGGWSSSILRATRGTQSTARVVVAVAEAGADFGTLAHSLYSIGWEWTSDFEGVKSLVRLNYLATITLSPIAPSVLVHAGLHGDESLHFLFDPPPVVLDGFWHPVPSGESAGQPVLAPCRLED